MFSSIFIFLFLPSLCYVKANRDEIFERFIKILLIDKKVQTQLLPFNNGNNWILSFGISEEAMHGMEIYRNEIEEILGAEGASQFYNFWRKSGIVRHENDIYYCYANDIVQKIFPGSNGVLVPPKFFDALSKYGSGEVGILSLG
uniref:Peptidase A1 domain-containing protein n=1 Tax=Meloidogyne hapla TaxID=6305 RepID=A0A1I8C1P3_MELHA